MSSYLAILGCVFGLAVGQILFKLLSSQVASLPDIVASPRSLGLFVVAIGIYAVTTLAWILALRFIPLSHAYLFMSLGFVFVPLLSHFVLGERITLRYAAGAAVIIAGVWLASS